MFWSRVAVRVFCASVGFLLLAGSARAQFDECGPLPADVPEAVFGTIADMAAMDFGTLSQKTCDGIVKRGVAGCKAQVKASNKCAHKTIASLYDILSAQCAQIVDAVARASCKDGVKGFPDFYNDGFDSSAQDGLAVCDGMFAVALNGACMDILVKVGGP